MWLVQCTVEDVSYCYNPSYKQLGYYVLGSDQVDVQTASIKSRHLGGVLSLPGFIH